MFDIFKSRKDKKQEKKAARSSEKKELCLKLIESAKQELKDDLLQSAIVLKKTTENLYFNEKPAGSRNWRWVINTEEATQLGMFSIAMDLQQWISDMENYIDKEHYTEPYSIVVIPDRPLSNFPTGPITKLYGLEVTIDDTSKKIHLEEIAN